MSNPHEPGRISVTLKQDGREGTWIVFHGSAAEIRSQIIDVFSMEGEDDTPLYDLINEATRLYKSTGNISSTLGGRVIKDSKTEGGSTGGSAWDRAKSGNGAEDAPAADVVDLTVVRLTAEIEAAESRPSLKELYARNKEAFDANPDLMAAYKAKGKSLPA